MLETLKATLKRQGGFTLIEVLTVIAIVGTLAGVVSASTVGTGKASRTAAAREDASIFNSAIAEYFADQPGREQVTASSVTVVALFNDETEPDVVDVEQSISNRWPETFITEQLADIGDIPLTPYANEFPTINAESSGLVVAVNIRGLDQPNGDLGPAITRAELLEQYTAIDFDLLVSGGYATAASETFRQTTEAQVVDFHTHLWLFKKSTSAGGSGPDDSRDIALFRLISIDDSGSGTVTLGFKRIR